MRGGRWGGPTVVLPVYLYVVIAGVAFLVILTVIIFLLYCFCTRRHSRFRGSFDDTPNDPLLEMRTIYMNNRSFFESLTDNDGVPVLSDTQSAPDEVSTHRPPNINSVIKRTFTQQDITFKVGDPVQVIPIPQTTNYMCITNRGETVILPRSLVENIFPVYDITQKPWTVFRNLPFTFDLDCSDIGDELADGITDCECDCF